MATDGVKIIDGDTAHDTYWGIMDLYDSGATFETIRSKIPFPQQDIYDDFDYEIYTTAYALAAWEIGEITEEMIQEVKNVIEKGACVRIWTEEYDPKMGKQREKELNKLLQKITSPNAKVRKRKKYKKIEEFLFEINEVLTFQLPDNNFYATVLLGIHQYRGRCTYYFGKILYKGITAPSLEAIKQGEIIGRKIPSGVGMDINNILATNMEEILKGGDIQAMLKAAAEKIGSYVIGMSMTGIDHKDLMNITGKFTSIGKLNFSEAATQQGSLGGAVTFEDLTRDFDNLEANLQIFGEETFKIKTLLQ